MSPVREPAFLTGSPARQDPHAPSGASPRSSGPLGAGRVTGVDRAHRRIQCPDHAAPRLLTPPAASTYPAHQIGVLSAGLVITWQRSSSRDRAAPIGIYRAVSPSYSRNRV